MYGSPETFQDHDTHLMFCVHIKNADGGDEHRLMLARLDWELEQRKRQVLSWIIVWNVEIL